MPLPRAESHRFWQEICSSHVGRHLKNRTQAADNVGRRKVVKLRLRGTDGKNLHDGTHHADTGVIVASQQLGLDLQAVLAELLGEVQRQVMDARADLEGPASAFKIQKPYGRIHNGMRAEPERIGWICWTYSGAGACQRACRGCEQKRSARRAPHGSDATILRYSASG